MDAYAEGLADLFQESNKMDSFAAEMTEAELANRRRGGAAALNEDAAPRVQLVGVANQHVHDKRRYRYDTVRGMSEKLPFAASMERQLSAVEAGNMLHAIHGMYGLAAENEGVLWAFDRALWFCHTLNGGSVMNAGRATFSVPGRTHEFKYFDVCQFLGNDVRRFFRAFADDIRRVNVEVLRNYDVADFERREMHAALLRVAHDRNLSRHPDLAHDSADACTGLTKEEMLSLSVSKTSVLADSVNMADRKVKDLRTQTVGEAEQAARDTFNH